MARLTAWKVWGPAALVAAILVAVLPPGYSDQFDWERRGSSYRASLNAAEARAKELLGQRAWVGGELPGKLGGYRVVRRGALVVASSDRVPAGLRDAWVDVVTRDAAALPGAGTGQGGRTTLVLNQAESPPGRPAGRYIGPDLDYRTPLGDPCVARIDDVALRRADAASKRARGLLGQCSLALGYGRPGSAVRSWAARIRRTYRFRAWGLLLERWVPDRTTPDRFALSWEFYQQDYLNGRWRRCSEGDAASCAYLLDSQTAGEPRGRRSGFVWWLIQRDQGASFARFWRYDGTLDEASVAAFGVPFQSLAAEWLAPRIDLPPAGPRLPEGALLKTAALLAFSAAVAGLALRRRQTV